MRHQSGANRAAPPPSEENGSEGGNERRTVSGCDADGARCTRPLASVSHSTPHTPSHITPHVSKLAAQSEVPPTSQCGWKQGGPGGCDPPFPPRRSLCATHPSAHSAGHQSTPELLLMAPAARAATSAERRASEWVPRAERRTRTNERGRQAGRFGRARCRSFRRHERKLRPRFQCCGQIINPVHRKCCGIFVGSAKRRAGTLARPP